MNQEEEWLESAERGTGVADKERNAHQREPEARSLGQLVPIRQT